jgi:carbon-monoxide dehydrogenase medium subunit
MTGFSEITAYTKEREWEEYLVPNTLDEALKLLKKHRGQARVIAGGTDIVVASRKRDMNARVLVDISRVPGLAGIAARNGTIRIGATTTHRDIAESPLIRSKATALAEGAVKLGSPQIRNVGTIGGNIVNGQPGADTVIPLLALDAAIKVTGQKGERVMPLRTLFVGVGDTKIDSTKEIVTEILFPGLKEGEASATLRLAKRKALVLPVLTVSVVISVDMRQGKFRFARIAAGPVSTVPFRLSKAEEMMTDAAVTDDIIKRVGEQAAQEANPRTSLIRGSSDYRKAMVAVLVERGIRQAVKRLEGTDGKSKR